MVKDNIAASCISKERLELAIVVAIFNHNEVPHRVTKHAPAELMLETQRPINATFLLRNEGTRKMKTKVRYHIKYFKISSSWKVWSYERLKLHNTSNGQPLLLENFKSVSVWNSRKYEVENHSKAVLQA